MADRGHWLREIERLDPHRDYDRPSPTMRRAAFLGMRARARALRAAPPRLRPQLSRDLPQVRSYPGGWASAELGTFAPPPACPAHLTCA